LVYPVAFAPLREISETLIARLDAWTL